ncbi:hypothetical protein GN330_23285 [Nitratireductor sp. CAU 1489]|uniref:Oligosaccharide repeat unit polymerase n=1 Tax=Nitratireductor arenosus TaxID=2682096 RepID=A0A844QNL4_9HYPH|nr:hypothetical protein [Nitratireductor arenosus]MVB00175.1 hypothetical protein [Nitratireductor arenosus]
MIYLLSVLYAFVLILYVLWRPSIRNFGLPLLDSFVIGVFLFAAGSVVVWVEAIEYSSEVAHIGLLAGISGTLGASISARTLLGGAVDLSLAKRIRQISIGSGERFAVIFGLLLCTAVSIAFMFSIYLNEELFDLYYKSVILNEISLTPARIAMSSGEYGYFYPGYIKQVRDILFPILLVSVIIFRFGRIVDAILFASFFFVAAAGFLSGQRLVFAQFFLCILAAVLVDFFSRGRAARFSLLLSGSMGATTVAGMVFLTVMLGRLDIALSPDVAPARNVETKVSASQTESQPENVAQKNAVERKLAEIKRPEDAAVENDPASLSRTTKAAGASSELEPITAANGDVIVAPREADAEGKSASPRQATEVEVNLKRLEPVVSETVTAVSTQDSGVAIKKGTEVNADTPVAVPADTAAEPAKAPASDFYQLPRPIAAIVALVHRAIIAVPRENTISYEFWAVDAPTYGQGWITDLGGVKPGTQKQLSNVLSEANRGGQAGNSPMALAVDIFHNWGWVGVAVFPALFALVFAATDKILTLGNSPIFIGNKIFLFFSIPLMYSPFLILLYGGAVTISIIIYITILRSKLLGYFGLHPSHLRSV